MQCSLFKYIPLTNLERMKLSLTALFITLTSFCIGQGNQGGGVDQTDPSYNYFNAKDSIDQITLDPSLSEKDRKFYRRFEYFWDDRIPNDDPAHYGKPSAYPKALSQFVADPICGTGFGASWEPIGPFQDDEQKMGRVEAIYMNPLNHDEIVIGTNQSGIWRTTDQGQNWVCVTDDLRYPALGISDFAVNPTNQNEIWATAAIIGGQSNYGFGATKVH